MTIAEELAKKQKQVSVAEFFEKNRHLLGFANPAQSLLTAVKEAVDNALDACDEAKILPEIKVQLKEVKEGVFNLTVEDNGPGIIRSQIGSIFGKFLYGSKFSSNKQGRGQQGIGISSVVLYSQLTTGKPTIITSTTGKGKPAHRVVMHIDTKKNEPEILSDEVVEWDKKEGTKIEFEMRGKYILKQQSVPKYIKYTAIVNPHAEIIYKDPKNNKTFYPRVTEILPKEAKSIKPHPYDMEHGVLKRMLNSTKARNIKSFLMREFDKVGAGTAGDILKLAGLDPQLFPKSLRPEQVGALLEGMQQAKIMSPSVDCLSPIGADILKKSIESEYDVEFVHAISRPPAVYKGTPFQIECCIAYGGELNKEGTAEVCRFANKVPLLYQQGACAITKAIQEVGWKSYGLEQSPGSLPRGPVVIIVHMASVWVPFTSESKEAIAAYPAILREIKLALQECGRHLQIYLGKKRKAALEKQRQEVFIKYSGELSKALSSLTGINGEDLKEKLLQIAKRMVRHLNGLKSSGADAVEVSR